MTNPSLSLSADIAPAYDLEWTLQEVNGQTFGAAKALGFIYYIQNNCIASILFPDSHFSVTKHCSGFDFAKDFCLHHHLGVLKSRDL